MQVANLNLIPGSTPPRIHVSQGDVGRQFKLVLYDPSSNWGSFPTDGSVSIAISGTKPDHHAFSYTDTQTTFADNYVIVTTTYQMTAVSGNVECELRIIYGNAETYSVYTGNFLLEVEPACIPDDADLSESDIPKMNQVIEALDKIDSMEGIIEDAAKIVDEINDSVEVTRKNTEAAATSEANAKTYATNASNSATQSASSATASANSATQSASSATASANSATQSKNSATQSASSATSSANSATQSSTYATNSKDYSTLSQSWAIGGTSSRTGEDTNNSKYYSQQAESAVEKIATITQYTLTASNWSSSTTAVNGVYYYTYTITGVTLISEHPEYMITATNGILPTNSEQTAFDSIKYMYANGSTMTFYAQNKPASNVTVLVRGVK